MTTFADFQKTPKSSGKNRILALPALSSFLVCLVIGLAAASWWATAKSETRRKVARTEALARAAAVEQQFNHALTAAEALAALSRQGGGAIPNFQKVATDLQAAHPGLASLELQPGGVVSDIVPRTGQRAPGFNVFNDPAQRSGAQAAIQKRALAVAGPLRLADGQLGVIARVPIFQRGRDGGDVFLGFVAVSMRLSDAIARARLDEKSFFATSPITLKTSLATAKTPIDEIVPVRILDAEFRLAVQTRGGWISAMQTALAFLGVFCGSALIGLLLNTVKSRQVVEAALADKTRLLAREKTDREQAQENLRVVKQQASATQAELKQAQSALQNAESHVAEVQARLDSTAAKAQAAEEMAQARVKQEESSLGELQSRFETAQSKLKQAELKASDLQSRLDAATAESAKAAAENAAALAALEASKQDLKSRLLAAEQAEVPAAKLAELMEESRAELQKMQGVEIVDTVLPPATRAEPDDLAPWESPEPTAAFPQPEAPVELAAPATNDAPEPPAPTIVATAVSEPPIEVVVPQPEPKAKKKSFKVKIVKHKKPSSDNQVDLFVKQPSADQPVKAPLAEPAQSSAVPEAPAAPESEKSAPSASAPDLPDIEGVFTADGLTRANGDPDLYLQMLRLFAEQEAGTSAKIRDALVQGDSAAAERTVQTLKADANEIGAATVSSAASALERAIRDHSDPAEIEFVWADLDKILASLIVEIKALPAPKKEKAAHLPAPLSALNPAHLRKAVSQIVPLLAGQDPGALDCFKDNCATFQAAFNPETYLEFELSVKVSDFNGALEQLKKAAKKHGISV